MLLEKFQKSRTDYVFKDQAIKGNASRKKKTFI